MGSDTLQHTKELKRKREGKKKEQKHSELHQKIVGHTEAWVNKCCTVG